MNQSGILYDKMGGIVAIIEKFLWPLGGDTSISLQLKWWLLATLVYFYWSLLATSMWSKRNPSENQKDIDDCKTKTKTTNMQQLSFMVLDAAHNPLAIVTRQKTKYQSNDKWTRIVACDHRLLFML